MNVHDEKSLLAGGGDWDPRITLDQRERLMKVVRLDAKKLAILANGFIFSGEMSFGEADAPLFVVSISIKPTSRVRGQHAEFDKVLGGPPSSESIA